jgi:tetrapyrrole methylase family protein / MazG family protein
VGSPPLEPLEPDSAAPAELTRLDELVRTLRACCPWDRGQTHLSLAPHLLEEAYEAFDAIEALGSAGGPSAPPDLVAHLAEELGDVLIQVFFHSVLAEEEGWFTLARVAEEVHDKMVRRHPHVFSDGVAETPEDVAARWEILKSEEPGRQGAPGAIPGALPALTLVAKLLRRAEGLGIDLPSADERQSSVMASLDRLAAASSPEASGEVIGAVGELLLAAADLARRSGVDPETALRAEALKLRRALETGDPCAI